MQDNEKSKKKSFIVNNEQFELLIPGYPKGSDITVINTSYIPRKKNDDGTYQKDYIVILFRDNITGGKKFMLFKNLCILSIESKMKVKFLIIQCSSLRKKR